MAAKNLTTTVKPLLDQNNVRFIGIGFDSRFVQPFVEGGYFKGELYVDTEKECYNALQYKTFTWWDLLKYIVSSKWISAAGQVKSSGVGGDMKGDGFQNGGAMVIDKGGKLLYEYRQEDASEQILPEEILTALNIKETIETGEK